MTIYKIDEINFNNIVYSPPKGNNKKISLVGYRDPDQKKIVPLVFQTPEIYCAESIEKVTNNGQITHQLNVPIYCRSTKKTNKLYNFLKDLNNKVMGDAKKKGSEWFSGDFNNIYYKSIIRKKDNDKKIYKNGILKLKFVDNEQFKTCVFNENKKIVNPEEYLIADKCYIRIILEISALWITENNYFGLATRVYQVSIKKNDKPLITTETYAFIDNSDDSVEEKDYMPDTEVEPELDNNSENEKIKRLEKELNELSMTDNEYPNIVT
jgi:hypothetical protein